MAFLKLSPERNWFIAGVGLLTLLMSISSFISYQNSKQLIENSNKSIKTYETIKNLSDVFSEMTVAESARRGYIYFDNRGELERCKAAIKSIPVELQQLRQQMVGKPDQLKQLNELSSLMSRRIDLLEESIRLHGKESPVMLIQSIITNRSVALRDEIQQVIEDLQKKEELELKQSVEKSQASIRDRKLIEIWLTFSSFAVILVCSIALYSQLVKRQKAEALQLNLAQQKELSELKLRFFSMVSHEFRTPLSIISGSAQLLAEGANFWTEERRTKNLQRIQSAAKSMTQLLTDILTLTRAEAGKLECIPTMLDLESFCLNLIEDFEISSSSAHSIQFSSKCSYTHAHADERLLYSMLSNLLSNAIKYSPEGGTVQLILDCTAETIIFQIKDEGLGISLDEQKKLYEPFYRGPNAASSAGTGLGLTVVKKCVELHQGEIWVDSQEGVGTTFSVVIPRQCDCVS